jgi:prepilin-type N-terminal cleavage/methylation domain-containing protein
MKYTHGFTLIETLIVLAFFGLLSGLALTNSISSYDHGLARTDRDLVFAALREARAQSIAGVCVGNACSTGTPHGVFFSSSRLVIFQGANYASRESSQDLVFPFELQEIISPLHEITFAAGTANVATETTLSITGVDSRTETFSVNMMGGITDVLTIPLN